MKNFLIVDGNSILNRAFYGVRPLSTKEGIPTNAIYGMLNILKKHLDAINPKKDTASDEMCMFVVINTASISLLPTTVITLRAAAGSADPFSIILPVWLCSLAAICVGVTVAKLLSHRGKRGRL